jgi:hypothetical protein
MLNQDIQMFTKLLDYIIMTTTSLTMTISGFLVIFCDSQVFPSAYLTLLSGKYFQCLTMTHYILQ